MILSENMENNPFTNSNKNTHRSCNTQKSIKYGSRIFFYPNKKLLHATFQSVTIHYPITTAYIA